MTWNHDYDRRKASHDPNESEEDWVADARELLMRAAEGGLFRDVFRLWVDGSRSPFVAARASELLGRDVSAEDVKAFGVFDRRRDGWAKKFWKAIDENRLAAAREEQP